MRKDYIVEERRKTFYAKANLDIDATERMQLRGNLGVQYIDTDQSSTGFNANGGTVAGSQKIGASYGDILPSLTWSADFGDGWMVRFGCGQDR